MSNPAPTYQLDRIFNVNPNTGNDATGDGSPAKPFATIGAANTAITKARWNRPTTSNDAILIGPGTYPSKWSIGLDNDNVVVAGSGGRVTLVCDQTGFNVGGRKSVHFQDIFLQTSVAYDHSQEGVGFNCIRGTAGLACDDITFDRCGATGFAQGISFLGDSGSRLRVWNGFWVGSYWLQSNGIPGKAQGIFHEGTQADIRYNVIAFNGWCGDLTNPAVVTQLMFSHGVYASAAHNPKPGISTGNFYVCNAASGIQLRTGGTIYGDVFTSNGVACDAFTDGATGDILGTLVLGNREPGLWTGGGLLAQSDHQTIAGNYFLRANPTTAPALLLGWNASGNDITGTAKPSPTSVAAVSGNVGVYPGPVSQVSTPRAFQTLDGNTIKPPPATVPDLITWAQTVGFTGATHRDLVAWFKANPDKVDAAGCIAWGSALANQLVTPPIVMVPGPVPAAFDVTCTIDPAAQTILQKK